MGSSMSNPNYPERNKIKHKVNKINSQHPTFNSLNKRITLKKEFSVKRPLSHPSKQGFNNCCSPSKGGGDPEANQLQQTPAFTSSFVQNYMQQCNSDNLGDKKGRKTIQIKEKQVQSVLVYQDNYHILPEKTKAQHSVMSGELKESQHDVMEQQFKLSLNSKIKAPSGDIHITFSEAIEEKKSINQESQQIIEKSKPAENSKINRLLQKMMKQEKTTNLLDKYLPKSKLQTKKNLNIKLVQPKRTLLGKAVDSQAKPQSTIEIGGKVENYYANWKKRQNKRKKSLPRLEQPSPSKIKDQEDYYEILNNNHLQLNLNKIKKPTQPKLSELRHLKNIERVLKNGASSSEKGSSSKLSSCRSDRKTNIIYF